MTGAAGRMTGPQVVEAVAEEIGGPGERPLPVDHGLGSLGPCGPGGSAGPGDGAGPAYPCGEDRSARPLLGRGCPVHGVAHFGDVRQEGAEQRTEAPRGNHLVEGVEDAACRGAALSQALL